MKPKDESGKRYGKLVVIKMVDERRNGCVCWLVKCDCGNELIVTGAGLRSNHTKHCGCGVRGENNWRWAGGRIADGEGYVKILRPEHPNAYATGYVSEHVYVMSEHIKRPIRKGETVHHRNGNRSDNRLDNLELRVGPHGVGADAIPYAVDLLERLAPHKLAKTSPAELTSWCS